MLPHSRQNSNLPKDFAVYYLIAEAKALKTCTDHSAIKVAYFCLSYFIEIKDLVACFEGSSLNYIKLQIIIKFYLTKKRTLIYSLFKGYASFDWCRVFCQFPFRPWERFFSRFSSWLYISLPCKDSRLTTTIGWQSLGHVTCLAPHSRTAPLGCRSYCREDSGISPWRLWGYVDLGQTRSSCALLHSLSV